MKAKKKDWITYTPDEGKYGANDIILTNFYPDHLCYDVVKQVSKELKLQIWVMDNSTDSAAYPHFMLILDPDLFSDEDSGVLIEMLKIYDCKNYSVLFTKMPTFKLNTGLKKFTIKQPDVFNYDNLKLIVLNRRSSALRHYKQHIAYDKKLFRLMNILLNLMSNETNMTTRRLCSDFNVSAKTIHRDISILNILGNDISFNKSTHQWELQFSPYKFDFAYNLNNTKGDE